MPIEVKNLSHIYMKDTPFEKKALDNISLTIQDDEFIALIGHTGSGKSTLIQHLNGLTKSEPGTIFVDNVDIMTKGIKLNEIRKKVGIVFQYPEYQLFEETIEKDVAYGPKNLGLDDEEVKERVKKALKIVGIDYEIYKDKSPFELSGGQKRRVAIAGIIAMEPKVLILDEPTAGLDPKGRDEILLQIKKLHDEYGTTIILVSHNMEDVAKHATRIIVMNEGKCILNGKPEEVFKEIDTLEKVGLAAPQTVYLARELRKRGFNISENLLTVDQAKNELLNLLRSSKND